MGSRAPASWVHWDDCDAYREAKRMKALQRLVTAVYRELKHNYTPYLFVLPALSVVFVFTILPAIQALVMSFFDWRVLGGLRESEFVGVRNYRDLMSMPGFTNAVRNTLLFALIFAVGTLVVSMFLALLLNEDIRARNWFRVIYYLPAVCSSVAIALVWQWMYWPTQAGLLNSFIARLGLTLQNWLGKSHLALPAIGVMLIWKNMGYYMVIFLAGLQAIPRELYEAAVVDGARWWGTFRYVTLPLLKPITGLVSILLTIQSLQIFSEIYVMTGGGPANSTITIGFYMYRTGFEQGRWGYAAAVAYMLFVAILAFTILQRKFYGRDIAY